MKLESAGWDFLSVNACNILIFKDDEIVGADATHFWKKTYIFHRFFKDPQDF